MRRIALLSISVLIAVFACGPTDTAAKASEGVDLARLNGWDIVLEKDAIPSEKYAAEEFQEFFRQASGVKLPISHTISRRDKHVFIGSGELMQASPVGFSVKDLGPEDLHIVVRDNNIAIAGGRPRGTLYGVYTFLEDYLGVRFLTHDHTHVPAVGQQRPIGPLDRVYRPPFVNYRHAAYKAPRQYPVFAARTRNNANHDEPRFGGNSPFGNTNHSWYRQVSIDKYGKDHPEYYALIGGKRQVKWQSQLCLTNPDVFKIVLQAVRDEIERRPEDRNISVTQNDGFTDYCRCENCAAIDRREGSHAGALLTFVNKVADEVGKTHPDVFIGTVAYTYSRKPPRNIRPRDNVEINFSTCGACQLHAFTDASCPKNVAFMQDLRGWPRITKNLYAWTYNTYFRSPPLPYPNLHTIKPNINTLADAGVKGVFMQSHAGPWADTPLMELAHYVMSRLLWNPKLNDKELIDEFIDLYYGKAAPTIHRFVNMIHKHYRDAGTHNDPLVYHGWELPVDKGVAKAGLRLFSQAMKLAENDKVKARVERASICAYAAVLDPIWRLKNKTAIDPALAAYMRPIAKEFFRLCEKHGLGGYGADRERIEKLLAPPTGKLSLLPIGKEWRFATDPEKQGEGKQYFKADFDDSNWTVLKEYDFWPGQYTGVCWYRQTINPPADIAGKKHLYLLFGSVDEEAFVYINGEYAFERSVKSSGQGPEVLWNQPFLHDVKGLIRPGRSNVIAVKVHNTALAGGIWRPVYLFPTDEEWTAQAIFDSL